MAQAERGVIAKVVVCVVATLLFIAVTFLIQYRDQEQRAQRKADIQNQTTALCKHDQRAWTALHDVIAAASQPNSTGVALHEVKIPPGTPPQVVDILAQIAGPPPAPGAISNVERLYKAQGPRPVCS